MRIEENHWKSQKNNENQWKSMRISKNWSKSMQIYINLYIKSLKTIKNQQTFKSLQKHLKIDADR